MVGTALNLNPADGKKLIILLDDGVHQIIKPRVADMNIK